MDDNTDYNSDEFKLGWFDGFHSRQPTLSRVNDENYKEGWLVGDADKGFYKAPDGD